MRYINLVKPVDYSFNDTLNSNSEGVIVLSNSSASFTARLTSAGETFNDSASTITIKMDTKSVGGKKLLRSYPGEHGFMPHDFSRPSQVFVSPEESPSQTQWFGQSSLGVREYKKFEIDTTGNDWPVSRDRNGRLFSYDGELYYLCEKWDFTETGYKGMVNIFRYDQASENFVSVKRFTEMPVDSDAPDTSYQYGSPDFFEMGGAAHIVYKVCDRNEQVNSFVVWRSEDMTAWTLVSENEIENQEEFLFDEFRLRCATDGDSVMVVFHSIASVSRDYITSPITVYKQDMRSYTSFDGGTTFKTKHKSHTSVKRNNLAGVESVRTATSLHTMFIPENIPSTLLESISTFNTNFALYFDDDMQSYVIIRGGMPAGGNTYLMAAKTVDSKFQQWEPCLRYKLDMSANGDVRYNNSVWDAFNEYRDADEENSYLIKDVDVSTDGPEKVLALTVETNDNVYPVITDHEGTAISTFRFVNDALIPPGSHDKLFAYGGKFHREWSFVSSLINCDTNGIICPGNACEYSGNVTEPLVTHHRKQLVSSDRRGGAYKFLSFHKPWSNVGERYDYNFSWTSFLEDYSSFGIDVMVTGFSTHSFSDGVTEFDISSGGETGYYFMSQFTGTSNPNPVERAALSSPWIWKARFEIGFDFFAAGHRFFQCEVGDTNGYSILLELDSTGGITAESAAGTSLGSVSGVFSGSNMTEILCGVGYDYQNALYAFLWYRQRGETEWSFGFKTSVSAEAISSNIYRVGAISGAAGGNIVYVGSMHFSSYHQGYRNCYIGDKRDFDFTVEGCLNYKATLGESDNLTAEPCHVYNEPFRIYDGSELLLDGYGEVDEEAAFSVTRSDSLNSVSNVGNRSSNYPYDFTNDDGRIWLTDIESDIDAIGLVNIMGAYGFTIKSGTYDSGSSSWTASNEQDYTIPYQVLDASSVSGKFLILNEAVSEDFEIVGHNILVYNTSTSSYEDQFFVKQNYGTVIEVGANLPAISNREFRLFQHSSTYNVPVALQDHQVDDFMIEFHSPANYVYRALGALVIGNRIDMREIVNVEAKTVSGSDIITSDLGRSYNRRSYDGAYVTRISLTASALYNRDNEQSFAEGLIHELRHGEEFLFVEGNDKGVATYLVTPVEGASLSPNTFFKDAELTFDVVEYDYRPISQYEKSAPVLTASLGKTALVTGQNMTFSASAVDPDGESVTYEWDFGEGTTSSLASGTFSYGSTGDYTVTCTCTNDSGESTVKTFTVYVSQPVAVDITASWTGGPTVTVGATETLTLTLVDKDSNTVTADNSTIVRILLPGNFSFDGDGDTVFNEDEDFEKSVTAGEVDFDFKCLSPGAQSFYVVANNIEKAFTINFA